MKSFSLVLIFLASASAFAQLESIECKREIVQKGLTTAIEGADLATLTNGAFEVADLQYTEWSDEAYAVGVTHTNSVDQSKTYYEVYVEPVQNKVCRFTGRM